MNTNSNNVFTLRRALEMLVRDGFIHVVDADSGGKVPPHRLKPGYNNTAANLASFVLARKTADKFPLYFSWLAHLRAKNPDKASSHLPPGMEVWREGEYVCVKTPSAFATREIMTALVLANADPVARDGVVRFKYHEVTEKPSFQSSTSQSVVEEIPFPEDDEDKNVESQNATEKENAENDELFPDVNDVSDRITVTIEEAAAMLDPSRQNVAAAFLRLKHDDLVSVAGIKPGAEYFEFLAEYFGFFRPKDSKEKLKIRRKLKSMLGLAPTDDHLVKDAVDKAVNGDLSAIGALIYKNAPKD